MIIDSGQNDSYLEVQFMDSGLIMEFTIWLGYKNVLLGSF